MTKYRFSIRWRPSWNPEPARCGDEFEAENDAEAVAKANAVVAEMRRRDPGGRATVPRLEAIRAIPYNLD